MYSWTCDDLGGATLYACERVENPDWANNRWQYSMTDRAYPFDIVGYFYHHIANAQSTGTAYSTGILKLARVYYNSALANLYAQFQITVDTGGNVTFSIGHGDGTGWIGIVQKTYTPAQFRGMDLTDREIYFLYMRDRHPLTYAGMPNYTGAIFLNVIFGAVEKYTGTWVPPGTGYPDGHMRYTLSSTGSLEDILGGAYPCASDNEASRKEQSELVAALVDHDYGMLAEIYQNSADTHFCGEDGNYNPDPDDPRKKDPNEDDPEGNSKPGGGGGNHDRRDDPIPLPDLPDISVSDTGMITLYTLTPSEMQTFTSYLWLDLTQPGGVWAQLKNLFADPLDFIIGLRAMPFTPTSTRSAYPKFGAFQWPHAYDVVTGGQYRVIDCGELDIQEYWGSAFDYDPYTKIQIYLPGVGFRELPVDDIMGKRIGVMYHCDCFTGDCVAFVYTPSIGTTGPQIPQIIGQWGGNLGYTVPLARLSYDNTVQSGITLMSRALGFATNAFMQGSADGTEVSAGNMVESTTMQTVNGQKRSVERSGASGSCIGYMSSQRPYIVKTIPRQSLPAGYKDIEGYPANLAGPLSVYSGSGYTTIEKITLTGITATDQEKVEIERLLQGGVLI